MVPGGPDDQHVTRRELSLILDRVREELRSLESRITVKILLAAVAGSALGKAIGPTVAAGLAAVGLSGWALKSLLVALHR